VKVSRRAFLGASVAVPVMLGADITFTQPADLAALDGTVVFAGHMSYGDHAFLALSRGQFAHYLDDGLAELRRGFLREYDERARRKK
jgi:hypothetical protein